MHFSVSFIFGVLGSKSNDYQTYAYLFVVNAVLALFSTPIVYQITKLRLVLNPIKGALLCTVTLIAFSWVLVFGAGNGHGAFALPLPASVFVFLGFYHGLLGRQEAYIFASALSQLVLSYTIFWSSVQHHRIKFERSITSTKL